MNKNPDHTSDKHSDTSYTPPYISIPMPSNSSNNPANITRNQFAPPFSGRPPGGNPPGRPPGGNPPGGNFPGGRPPLDHRPPSPPPSRKPSRVPETSRIGANSMNMCLGNFTYVWLKDGSEFWMYPIFTGYNTIAGFRWNVPFGWGYYGVEPSQISAFYCAPR